MYNFEIEIHFESHSINDMFILFSVINYVTKQCIIKRKTINLEANFGLDIQSLLMVCLVNDFGFQK